MIELTNLTGGEQDFFRFHAIGFVIHLIILFSLIMFNSPKAKSISHAYDQIDPKKRGYLNTALFLLGIVLLGFILINFHGRGRIHSRKIPLSQPGENLIIETEGIDNEHRSHFPL